jgi:hypothetical protein
MESNGITLSCCRDWTGASIHTRKKSLANWHFKTGELVPGQFCFVDCASRYIRVTKTNLMQYLSSVYFISQPLHVSGISVAQHQEEFLFCLLHQGPEPRPQLHCCHQAYCTPCFLEVPTVTVRCLHVLRDARDPSSERGNFNGWEVAAGNFA